MISYKFGRALPRRKVYSELSIQLDETDRTEQFRGTIQYFYGGGAEGSINIKDRVPRNPNSICRADR